MTLDADVAVIGGGIAGASIAWAVAPHAKVVILEAEDGVGYHSTGRSAAIQTQTYAGQTIRQLTRAAGAILDDEFAGNKGLLHDRGLLWVATAGQEADLARLTDSVADGIATQAISSQDARQICPALRPGACIGAIYERDAKAIDVDVLHQEFLQRARSHGAAVITNCRVERIAHEGPTWILQAKDHTVRATHLVDAAGAWADQVAAMAGVPPAGLTPLRRTAFLFPAPAGNGHTQWPFTIDVGETWYFEPQGPVLLGSNCDEHPDIPSDVRAEDIDVAEAIEKINALTSLDVRRVLKQWAGLRTFAPDRAPVIGPDPDAPRFHWYAGLGGFGIMTAAAVGRIVAAGVLGLQESGWSAGVASRCSVSRLRR